MKEWFDLFACKLLCMIVLSEGSHGQAGGRWLFFVHDSCPEEKPTLHDGEMVLPQGMINMAQWEGASTSHGFWCISFPGSSWCSRGQLPAAIQQQDCMFCSTKVVPWGSANPTGVCPNTPSQPGPHLCHQLSAEHKMTPPLRTDQLYNIDRFSFPGHCEEASAGYSSPEGTLSQAFPGYNINRLHLHYNLLWSSLYKGVARVGLIW